jgi:hypothetical protein
MRLALCAHLGSIYPASVRFCFFSSASPANQPVSSPFSPFTPYEFQTYHFGTSFRTQNRLRYSIPLTRSYPIVLLRIQAVSFFFFFFFLTLFVVQTTIIHNYGGVVSLSLNAFSRSLDPPSLLCLHSSVFTPLSSLFRLYSPVFTLLLLGWSCIDVLHIR